MLGFVAHRGNIMMFTLLVAGFVSAIVFLSAPSGALAPVTLRPPADSVWLVAPRAVVRTSDLGAAEGTNPQAIVDHDLSTLYWTGRAPGTGDFIEVDLGDVYTVNGVALLMGSTTGPFARPHDYLYRGRILVSSDGLRWESAGRDLFGLSDFFTTFEARPVRFVRVTATADQAYWVQVRELLVSVPASSAPDVRPALIHIEESVRLYDAAQQQLTRATEQLLRIDRDEVILLLTQAEDVLLRAYTAYDRQEDADALSLAKQAQQLALQASSRTKESRRVEVRAAWVDRGVLASGPASVIETLDRLQGLGINLIYPEVISKGAAAYRSEVYPFDTGFAPWQDDVLTFLVEQAHARGMQVHPWVWVMSAGYYHQLGPLLQAHPDWAELSVDGDIFAPNEWGTAWLSPVLPEVRQFLTDAFVELVTKYNVDGIHFDYIRYNEEGYRAFGYSDASLQAFTEATGYDARRLRFDSERLAWNEWREANVTGVVIELSNALREARPELQISAAVVSDPKDAIAHSHQNWAKWLENGWIDHVALMNYTDSASLFEKRNRIALSAVTHGGVLPGIGIWTTTPQGVSDQIASAQQLGAAGTVLFAASTVIGETERVLREGPFRAPAISPLADPWLALSVTVAELQNDLANWIATGRLPGEARGILERLDHLHRVVSAGPAGELGDVPNSLGISAQLHEMRDDIRSTLAAQSLYGDVVNRLELRLTDLDHLLRLIAGRL